MPHISLVSSIGANPTSWFLYPKTKVVCAIYMRSISGVGKWMQSSVKRETPAPSASVLCSDLTIGAGLGCGSLHCAGVRDDDNDN